MDTDEFFEHFGIKGMKWGIRKDHKLSGNSDNSRSGVDGTKKKQFKITKKQALIGASVVVGTIAAVAIIANRGVIKTSVLTRGFEESTMWHGKSEAEKLLYMHGGSKDFSFPKGQIFTRISSAAETKIRQGAYATYKPKDVARYKSSWVSEKNRYEIKIEALSDIKMPSLKTRIETMAEIIDKPIQGVYRDGKSIRSNLIKQQPTWRAKLWARYTDSQTLGKYKYANITGDNWSTGLGKAFTDRLMAKGYGAMPDDRDGSNGLAKMPVVLLDSKKFRVNNNKQMSKKDMDKAYKELKTLLNV